jgi:hypothetical protein
MTADSKTLGAEHDDNEMEVFLDELDRLAEKGGKKTSRGGQSE